MKSRAYAGTFVGKVAGSCERAIALSFILGLSWLGIRIEALPMLAGQERVIICSVS